MNNGGAIAVEVSVQVADDVVAAECPAQADISAWVLAALSASEFRPSRPIGIGVRMVAAGESAELNQTYRGKSGPTNVLAFPAGPPLIPEAEQNESELGDLVLCVDVATSEAAAQGKTAAEHFAHLTVHGTLHLLGYDHTGETEANRMESLERQALQRLSVPDPYGDNAAR